MKKLVHRLLFDPRYGATENLCCAAFLASFAGLLIYHLVRAWLRGVL